MGVILNKQGRQEEAIAAFQSALENDPSLALSHDNLGDIYKSRSDLEKSKWHYQKSVHIRPTHSNTHCALGDVYRKQNQLDAAVACYQEAIRLHPDFSAAYNNLGLTLYHKFTTVHFLFLPLTDYICDYFAEPTVKWEEGGLPLVPNQRRGTRPSGSQGQRGRSSVAESQGRPPLRKIITLNSLFTFLVGGSRSVQSAHGFRILERISGVVSQCCC